MCWSSRTPPWRCRPAMLWFSRWARVTRRDRHRSWRSTSASAACTWAAASRRLGPSAPSRRAAARRRLGRWVGVTRARPRHKPVRPGRRGGDRAVRGGHRARRGVARVAPASIHALIGPTARASRPCSTWSPAFTRRIRSVWFAGHQLVGRRPYEIAGLGVARAFQNMALYPSRRSRRTCCSAATTWTRSGFVACGLRLGRPPRGAPPPGPGGGDRRLPRNGHLLGAGRDLSHGEQKKVDIARAVRRTVAACCSTSRSRA